MPGRIYCDGSGPSFEASDVSVSAEANWGDEVVFNHLDGNDQRGTIGVESPGRQNVATCTLSNFDNATDDFHITYNTHETAQIDRDVNYTVAGIVAALEGLSDFAPGDLTVTALDGSSTLTDGGFIIKTLAGGAFAHTDLSAFTITNPTGCTGSFAETITGGSLPANPTVTVTFKRPYHDAAFVVLSNFHAEDSEQWAVTAESTTGFTATLVGTPSVNTEYGFNYFVLG